MVFRLLKILWVLARYRVNRLLPLSTPLYVKLFLFWIYLIPAKKLSRAEALRRALEDLGPIFIKFGQLLSTRPDLIPADLVFELNYLQDRVKPFDSEEFRRLVELSLGHKIEDIFSYYEASPLASASIAQVHAAKLIDGRDVIIKVVRPNLEHTIEQDIYLLRLLAKFIERWSLDGRRLRPVEVVDDYRITILDELDLQREAANASMLRRNFLNSPLLYVPEILWPYTRPNLLVMERIYGIPVTDIQQLKAQNTNLKLLAERGVEIFFTQVFEHNFFHADMHPGNIFVSYNNPEIPQYIAVDMAIVASLSNEDQYYLARNFLAMFRRDYRQVAELHVQSGWVPAHVKVGDFEAAIRTVCEPIFEKPLKDISFANILLNLFRTARRFDMEIQPQLVLLQKTLLNIEGLGRQLYPDLDLWQTAHPFLERWIRKRYSLKRLWKLFKYHSPDWMEKFPQVPQLLFTSLQQMPALVNEVKNLRQAQGEFTRRNRRFQFAIQLSWLVIAIGLLGVAFFWY